MMTSDTDCNQPTLEAVWQRIKRAGDRCDDRLRLMTVTTVDDAGRPDARLMILRGASSSKQRLWFYSMQNSAKVAQLRNNPSVCIVGYDPSEIVQVIVRGRAMVRVDGAIVRDHWAQFCAAATNIIDHSAESCRSRSAEDPWLASVIQSLEGGTQNLSREDFALIDLHVESIEWIRIDGPTISRFVYDITAG